MFIINVHHNIDVSLFIIKCILSNLIDGQKKLYFIRFFFNYDLTIIQSLFAF